MMIGGDVVRGIGMNDLLEEIEHMSQADVARELWDIYHEMSVMDLAKLYLSISHASSDRRAIIVSVVKNRAEELTDEVMGKAATIMLEKRLDQAVMNGA